MKHPTFLALLGNTNLQYIHLTLHSFHYLTAFTRFPLVRDQHTDNDEDNKKTDAAECRDDGEAELERLRRTFVHQLTNNM